MEEINLLPGVHVDKSEFSKLDYEVVGRPAFATVSINLKDAQTITAEAGSLLWSSGSVQASTRVLGGPFDGCSRTCAGEPCCFNDFTGPGNVTFGFPEPGDALPFVVTPDHGWILTSQAYICGTPNVQVTSRFSGCMTCCCSGEGAFFSKVYVNEGTGLFFAGGYGEIVRHDLAPGKTMIVDGGLFFAAHCETNVGIKILGSLYSAVCGGEGVVMEFTGPAIIYTQSRDPSIFRAFFFPSSSKTEDKEKDNQASNASQES